MSSESSIHLDNKLIRGQVTDLGENYGTTTALILTDEQGGRHTNDERFTLFVKKERLLEMSLLFHKIAQDLAALLPDVDACCRCVPGAPDDQCAEHGYGAFKINKAGGDGTSTCALCGWPCDGGPRVVHSECAAREQYEADRIPIDDAREAVEPPHRWG